MNNYTVYIAEQVDGFPALDVSGTANISSDLTVGTSSSFSYDTANDYDFTVWGTTRLNFGVTIGGEGGLDGGLTITNKRNTSNSVLNSYGSEIVIIQSDIDARYTRKQ